MASSWRLIVDGPLDGALNMALDRAAQLAREEASIPPTLRLYSWKRPTVSLGRFQTRDSVDRDAARTRGVDVVRRPTGGRGVLHDDEVTYSIIASVEDGVPRGVTAAYMHLCGPLVAAYRALGIDARITENDKASAASPACYLATTRADLSLGEKKLAGSAQVWSGSTVLQHGSFTRTRDLAREREVFGLSEEEMRRLASHAVVMSDVAGTMPTPDEIIGAIVSAFERALRIRLVPGAHTAREAELAATLIDAARHVTMTSAST